MSLKESDAKAAMQAYEQIGLIDRDLIRVVDAGRAPFTALSVDFVMTNIDKISPVTGSGTVATWKEMNDVERGGFIMLVLKFERERLERRRQDWAATLTSRGFSVPGLPVPPVDAPKAGATS